MINQSKSVKIFSTEFKSAIIIVTLIQLTFFFITSEDYFFSDDYQYIIGVKLYNLIQGHALSFENLFLYLIDPPHYAPIFFFINQFNPDNPIWFHGFVISLLGISSLIIFKIVEKLTSDKKISLLASVMFCANYSIHIKTLVWDSLHTHMTNSTIGFLSVLVMIISFEKKSKLRWYFLYIFLSMISVLNFETGLIHPIITFLIIFLFYKKKLIKAGIVALLPIILYTLSVFAVSGEILPLLKDRTNDIRLKNYEKVFNLNSNNKIYFYRSQYAPRNSLGYTLRAADNALGSFNFSSVENIVKYYFDKETVKVMILNNYRSVLFIIILFAISIIAYLYNKFRIIKFKDFVLKFVIIYLALFCIYTFIYFRKDINMALAFPSSVLISIVVVELYKVKNRILSYSIIFLFFLPSILYAFTGFEYVNEWPTRSTIKKVSESYYEKAKNKEINMSLENDSDFIYLYYYLNYKDNKAFLTKYN